jgi:hypothetical protein
MQFDCFAYCTFTASVFACVCIQQGWLTEECLAVYLQVAGLWYIQGIALGIALLLTAVKRIEYHLWLKAARVRRATRQQHEEAALKPSSQSPCGSDTCPGDASLEEPVQMLSLTVKQQRAHAHAHTAPSRPSPLGMLSSSSGSAVDGGDGQHEDCIAEMTLPPGGVASSPGGPTAAAVEGRRTSAPLGAVNSFDGMQQATRSAAALDGN